MFYVYQLYITELELEIGATEPSWHRPPPLESFGTSRELYQTCKKNNKVVLVFHPNGSLYGKLYHLLQNIEHDKNYSSVQSRANLLQSFIILNQLFKSMQSFMSAALKTVILPYVNFHLKGGFPLPLFHGYKLQNAQILSNDSRIMICSDVASTGQYNLNHLALQKNQSTQSRVQFVETYTN